MNWNLAVEKNHEALKRILAMLLAMVGMTAGDGGRLISPLVEEMSGPSTTLRTEGGAVERSPPNTLPRHLHRFVLRLLRPAEAATRRLIIVAARGLVVKLPKFREYKPKPKKPPLNRKNGYGTNIVIRPGPLPDWARELMPKRSASLSLPLLDPMKRFGVRRRYAKPGAMPRIRVLGGDDPMAPLFRRPEPLPPPAPTPDDPLDAGSIHRRLEALGRAVDDLPKQAMRMARWAARRDARLAREREGREPGQPYTENAPSPSRPFDKLRASPPLPHFVVERTGAKAGEFAPVLSLTKWGRGGEPEGRDGEGVHWEELGLTPESLALCRQAKLQGRHAHASIPTQPAKPPRFHRLFPMRPGRPPGWRRKPNHDVYDVLNELHGLAVWASERRDSS